MAYKIADDLEQLLDSALDDFQNLNLSSSASQRNGANKGKKEEKNGDMGIEVKGLGMCLPDLRSKKKKGKQKNYHHVEQAIGELREHTIKAVKCLDSFTKTEFGVENDTIEDWVKEFQELTAVPTSKMIDSNSSLCMELCK